MDLTGKVLSDSVFSGIRILLSTARGIVIIPLITKLLGAGSFGVWATVLGFVGLLSSTAGMHLHGSLIRYGSQDKNKEQTYSDILLIASLIGCILFGLIITLGTVFNVSALFNGEVTNQSGLVFASSLLIVSSMLWQINLNFPRSKEVVKLYDLAIIGRQIIEILVLVSIFILGGTVVIGIFALAGISFVLNGLIVAIIFYNYDIPQPNFRNTMKYVRYGGPMVSKELSSSLLANADKYLILFIISPTAVGIYAVARGISGSLTKFSSILNPTLYPSISSAWDRGKTDEIADLYTQIFRYYSILAIPAFFGLTFLAHQILTVIATPDIAEQGTILVPILAFGFLMRGFDNSLSYILTATKNTAKIAKAVGVAVSINVVLNLILITFYGILGAAIATTISQLFVFYLIYTYSISHIDFSMPFSTFARCSVSALVMISILNLIDLSLSPYSALALYPFAGAFIYFVTLVLIGEFDQEELSKARQKIPV